MVYRCFACKWPATKLPKRSLHRFPANEIKQKQWLAILGKSSEVVIKPNTYLCSSHFDKSCFRYGLVMGRALLKEDSIPSLNLGEAGSNGTKQTTINPNGFSTEVKNNCVLPSISQDIVPQSSNQEYINEEILHNANGNKQDIIYQKNITVENLTSNYVVVGVINKCAINTVGEEINVPLNGDVCGIHNYHLPTTVQTEKDTMARKDSTIRDAKRISWKTMLNAKSLDAYQIHRIRQDYEEKETIIRSLKRKNVRCRKYYIRYKSENAILKKDNKRLKTQQELLLANLEPIPKALLTHSQTLKKKCHEFPLSLKVFASTMACLSPKAFAYLRKVFPCLPNPASLRRWDGNADVQQGVCDAVAEVLDDEDKKRKKRKIPSKVIVDNVSNEADAGDYDESDVYHDHADVDQDSVVLSHVDENQEKEKKTPITNYNPNKKITNVRIISLPNIPSATNIISINNEIKDCYSSQEKTS